MSQIKFQFLLLLLTVIFLKPVILLQDKASLNSVTFKSRNFQSVQDYVQSKKRYNGSVATQQDVNTLNRSLKRFHRAKNFTYNQEPDSTTDGKTLESSNVYVMTYSEGQGGQKIYISSNYGQNFRDDGEKIKGALDKDEQVYPNMGIQTFFVNKWDDQKIFIQGEGKFHWFSDNGGQSYGKLDSPFGTYGQSQDLHIHPNKHDWILGRVIRTSCLTSFLPQPEKAGCAADLILSQDFGKTWTNLTEKAGGKFVGFQDFDWGVNADGDVNPLPVPEEMIFFSAYPKGSSRFSPFGQWEVNLNYYSSSDFLASSELEVQCGNLFEIIGKQVYVARPEWCPYNQDGSRRSDAPTKREANGNVEIFVSIDDGHEYSLVCIPIDKEKHVISVTDSSFNLVAAHNNDGAFVIAEQTQRYNQMALRTSTLYTSGYERPGIFAESLKNCHKDLHRSLADFQRIEGLPGFYVANVDAGPNWKEISKLSPNYFKNHQVTWLSRNGGSTWDFIKAPKKFTHSACNNCRGNSDCYLHLFGLSSWVSPTSSRPYFYSLPNAPGLIMGAGNTAPYGEGLSSDVDKTCTWISNDGGYTWRDLMADPYIYEYGDNGAIIVMAIHESDGVADAIYFSLDSGSSWTKAPLQHAMFVQNIRVEPNARSRRFIIHGRGCRKSNKYPQCSDGDGESENPGYIYFLDVLDQGNVRQCSDSDMEEWKVSDEDGNQVCVLGQQYTITRKSVSKNCYLPENYQRPYTKTSSCQCDSLRDFECDFGFQEEYDENKIRHCVKQDVVRQCPFIDQGIYRVSSTGLRLVRGDNCTGINKVVDDTNGKGCDAHGNCNDRKPSKGIPQSRRRRPHHHYFLWFLFLLLIGAVGFGVWWFRFASSSSKELVTKLTMPCIGGCLGCIDTIRDKISQQFSRYKQPRYQDYEPLGSGPVGLSSPQLYQGDSNRNAFR